MKRILSVIAIAAAAMFGATAASAAPPSPGHMLPSGIHTNVEKTHGYHRSCRGGRGWRHRHTRGGRRIYCGRRYYSPRVNLYIGPGYRRHRHYRQHRYYRHHRYHRRYRH
jgi:hypothetical protein